MSNLLRSRDFSNYSLLIDQSLKRVFLCLIETFIEILNQTLIAEQCLLILSQLEFQSINELFLSITLLLKLSIFGLCLIELLIQVASLHLKLQLIVAQTANLCLLLLSLLLEGVNLV